MVGENNDQLEDSSKSRKKGNKKATFSKKKEKKLGKQEELEKLLAEKPVVTTDGKIITVSALKYSL
jgi:ribosomal protein S8E